MSESFRDRVKSVDDIDFDDFLESASTEEVDRENAAINNAVNAGVATKAGIQYRSLQSVMDTYAEALKQAAITKNGAITKAPTASFKGFAAEEYFKLTLKINALAEGVPDYQIGVYTKGQLPDGSTLSGIDMQTDISVWTRKHFWSKPKRTVDYQSKIHNDASKYKHDMNNSQYQDVEFVGGAGQGVPDTVKVEINGVIVESDSITPEQAAQLAEDMKNQEVEAYNKRQEKIDKLNKVNVRRAIEAGAVTGLITSSIKEIIGLIRNSDNLTEEDFIKSFESILCGTIEGGVRGGATAGSVVLMGKMLNKEIAENSLEAIPAMVIANLAINVGKDFYKCFVLQSIDPDDVLCNSVNNMYTSFAGYGGAWVGAQAASYIATGTFASAQAACATGAAIGSVLGPIGTIVGSVVGGLVIGIGANAVVGTAEKDAIDAYNKTIEEINTHIELSGCERLYYFADSMSSLSDYKMSFKDLLPQYNLISDLKEYNLHKKALKAIDQQLNDSLSSVDVEMQEALKELKIKHQTKKEALIESFNEQRILLVDEYRDSVNTYVANSYMQYAAIYDVISGEINDCIEELNQNRVVYSEILNYMNHRNAINIELNIMLEELMEDEENSSILKPFIDRMHKFMQQDELLVGKQYVSFEESMLLVGGMQ